jgi:hypothetical protein
VPRGARRTGVQGRGTLRVLNQGYSTKEYSNKGTQNINCSIRGRIGGQCWAVLCALGVWQYISGSHGVLKGYSQVLGTHSRGTPGVPTLRGALTGGGGAQRCARVQREEGYSRGTHRVMIGYFKRVLTGYSQGADRVPIEYSRGTHTVLRIPPRRRDSLGWSWQSL